MCPLSRVNDSNKISFVTNLTFVIIFIIRPLNLSTAAFEQKWISMSNDYKHQLDQITIINVVSTCKDVLERKCNMKVVESIGMLRDGLVEIMRVAVRQNYEDIT